MKRFLQVAILKQRCCIGAKHYRWDHESPGSEKYIALSFFEVIEAHDDVAFS